jgi:hypothetical protein
MGEGNENNDDMMLLKKKSLATIILPTEFV